MTQTAARTVPYEVYQHEHTLRIQAERDRDEWKSKYKALNNEVFLSREIRHAPVLRPIDKAVLEEFRHVQKWGTVEDASGNKRANYKTIASNLKTSPDTVKRSAERLAKLHLAEIREHQGPEDERERKYIHVKEDRLSSIKTLDDPDHIVPKQGGNRYICPKCDSTDVAIKTVKTLRCNKCHHEEILQDKGLNEWIEQIGHKAQKQVAFKKSIHAQQTETVEATCFLEKQAPIVDEQKQLAEHSVYTLSVSEELKSPPIWCCHRDKVPYNVSKMVRDFQKAKSDDPITWTTYDQALTIYQESQQWAHPFDGLGVMNNGDYVFTDIDHCRDIDTGELSEQAQEIIACLDSYAEESYSGTGIHIISRGHIPRGRKHNGIEMYPNNRFFTFTGQHIAGTPYAIQDSQAALSSLYKELFPAEIAPSPIISLASQVTRSGSSSDEEILRKGKNDRKFMDLFHGTCIDSYYQKKDGTPDYSRADLALCQKIAYWGAGGDVSIIDRIFRRSGLMRPKWERDDYREKTINQAIDF
jgi:hypothetical protein